MPSASPSPQAASTDPEMHLMLVLPVSSVSCFAKNAFQH